MKHFESNITNMAVSEQTRLNRMWNLKFPETFLKKLALLFCPPKGLVIKLFGHKSQATVLSSVFYSVSCSVVVSPSLPCQVQDCCHKFLKLEFQKKNWRFFSVSKMFQLITFWKAKTQITPFSNYNLSQFSVKLYLFKKDF